MNPHDEGRWCGQNLDQRRWQNWNVDMGVPEGRGEVMRISWHNYVTCDEAQKERL